MMTNIPEDLTLTNDEDLASLEADLIKEFDDAVDSGKNDVTLLTKIADAIEAVRGESARRVEEAEKAAEAVAVLAERIRPAGAADPDAEGDEADDDSEEADAVLAPETPAEAEEADAQAEERDLVTASANTPKKAPSASAVRRRTPTPEAQQVSPTVTITAAADIPGVTSGSTLDKVALAKALHAKARTLSNGSGYVPVASIDLPLEHKLGSDTAYNLEVLEKATAPSSLTAAGWCAPSQNLYSFLSIEGQNGLLDLPTVQVTRGGMNVPGYIDISEATSGLWSWTEADSDDPEATKPCLMIPCPEFTDYRLEAAGLCLTNGNLTDRAFPELTARFVDLTLTAHLHRLSGLKVAAIASGAVGVTMSAVASSAAGSILHAIDVQVADYRSKYLMATDSILEVVFPAWVKEVVRADLAMRTGVNLTAVTDAQIDDHFAVRHVRAQYLMDYVPMSGMAPATAFPTSITFLIFAAGGYVAGDGGTIDLGIVRDSVLNATNDYTAAWTEQLWLVAQMGPAAREVTVNYSVDGVTGCCEAPVV